MQIKKLAGSSLKDIDVCRVDFFSQFSAMVPFSDFVSGFSTVI